MCDWPDHRPQHTNQLQIKTKSMLWQHRNTHNMRLIPHIIMLPWRLLKVWIYLDESRGWKYAGQLANWCEGEGSSRLTEGAKASLQPTEISCSTSLWTLYCYTERRSAFMRMLLTDPVNHSSSVPCLQWYLHQDNVSCSEEHGRK